jgi:hypothetical protein
MENKTIIPRKEIQIHKLLHEKSYGEIKIVEIAQTLVGFFWLVT